MALKMFSIFVAGFFHFASLRDYVNCSFMTTAMMSRQNALDFVLLSALMLITKFLAIDKKRFEAHAIDGKDFGFGHKAFSHHSLPSCAVLSLTQIILLEFFGLHLKISPLDDFSFHSPISRNVFNNFPFSLSRSKNFPSKFYDEEILIIKINFIHAESLKIFSSIKKDINLN